MKELAKAAMSVGMASALFGARQMTNLLSPNRKDQGDQAADTLNNLASTLMGQCGEPLRDTFDVADKMQREMLDTALRAFSVGTPGNAEGTSGSWTGAVTQAVSQMGQMFGGFTRDAGCGCNEEPAGHDEAESETGWGPIPPWSEETT